MKEILQCRYCEAHFDGPLTREAHESIEHQTGLDEGLRWYRATFMQGGQVVESGWMLAADDDELVNYAKVMGYGIDVKRV